MARRIGHKRRRGCRRHLHACLSRAGGSLPGNPQQQCSNARCLSQQRQSTAGSEIECTRIAPELDHHRTQRRATDRIGRCAQYRCRIRQHAQDQSRRITPNFCNADRVQPAHTPLRLFFTHPHPFTAQPVGKNTDEPCATACFRCIFHHQFMHVRSHQSPAQRAINTLMPSWHMPSRAGRRTTSTFNQRNAPLKHGKRFDCHLFYICSNF